MKKLLIALALATTPCCMAEWTDLPVNGEDVAVDEDVATDADVSVQGDVTGGDVQSADAGNGSDVQGADVQGSDATTTVTCDSPAKDRLINNGDGTWHDQLLGLDCAFFATTGLGKRCVPFYGHPFGSEAMGNSNFAEANPIGYWQSDDCQSHQVFIVVPDSMGHFSRYGFQMDLNGGTSILHAYNLVDPDPTTVSSTNKITGKATGMTNLHSGPKCLFTAAEPLAEFGVMLSNGTASFPACPYLTGLGLFAEMPTK